jgi:hypothetical protein
MAPDVGPGAGKFARAVSIPTVAYSTCLYSSNIFFYYYHRHLQTNPFIEVDSKFVMEPGPKHVSHY